MIRRCVTKTVVVDNETINGETTVNSNAVNGMYADAYSYIVKISGASPDISVAYQITDSDVGDISKIGHGEDSSYVWITPQTNGVIVVNASSSKGDGFTPAVSKYYRFVITGNAGNGADTKVSIILLEQC